MSKIVKRSIYKEVLWIIAVYVGISDRFHHYFYVHNIDALKVMDAERLNLEKSEDRKSFLSGEQEIRLVSAFVKALLFARPFVPLYVSLK